MGGYGKGWHRSGDDTLTYIVPRGDAYGSREDGLEERIVLIPSAALPHEIREISHGQVSSIPIWNLTKPDETRKS